MRRVPLIDLPAQYRAIKPEIDHAVLGVLERGQFILGPQVESLEREIAAYCRTPHAVAVASGTDAIELALRVCGVGAGDEVITSPFSFFATAEAILAIGAVPIFADIDPITFNILPERIDAAITPRTKAIVPVHLYGQACRMDEILRIAHSHGLRVVEDCAQAIGATFQGRPVGSFGDAGAFSFFPTKNLGGFGDGGIITTPSAEVAQAVRLLRVHGSSDKYRHSVVGTNSRLDEIQAAVLRVKLRYLDGWNEARCRHADRYRELFAHHGLQETLIAPQDSPDGKHVYHLFTVRLADRDRVRAGIEQQGIATQVAYPVTIPDQPAMKPWAAFSSACPDASAAAKSVLSLPLYPELSESAQDYVVDQLARMLVPT